MSTATGRSGRALNDCGCCEGTTAAIPITIANRPGLSAIAYRMGVHAEFKRDLLARLSGSDVPALQRLQTRDDDDFTIALLDGWATVADVLTFYQERIANESYLRTGTERESLLEMARMIGYELRPGVAAEVYLAFTLEAAPGAPEQVPQIITIDRGTRVQSTPGPGESPQTFEAVETITGRVAWNAMTPRLTRRHPLSATTSVLYFEGTQTNLKPSDGVLFESTDGTTVFGTVTNVTPDPNRKRTRVSVTVAAGSAARGTMPSIQQTPSPPNTLAGDYLGRTMTAADLEAEAELEGFDVGELFDALGATPQPAPRVMVFRSRAAVFGHNAPAWDSLSAALRDVEPVYGIDDEGDVFIESTRNGPYKDREDSWADDNELDLLDSGGDGYVFLDHTYPDVVAESTVVLQDSDAWAIYQVQEVREVSKSDFTISGKVSRLTLDGFDALDQFAIRTTTVYGQSEVLPLARVSNADPFPPTPPAAIELDGWYDGLTTGQRILVSGLVVGAGGDPVAEHAVIDEVEHVLTREGGTRILLVDPLARSYVRDGVTINANVARATHGETVEEVLGGGDAMQFYQRFKLRQPPLTYLNASNASGTASTLEVRVNGILWHEVPTLFERGPQERVYIVRLDDDGDTTVQFGDGVNGARLPTGSDNVRATYRKGNGRAGLVKANQLDLLMSRPLGLKAVTNPIAADGADDPESRDEARQNAPLKVLTLDRVVSLRDYEDFALAYPGIAKARSEWGWDGHRRTVILTVAGPNGASVNRGSTTYENLCIALHDAGDPQIRVRLTTYCKALFRLAADIIAHRDHDPAIVLKAVKDALRAAFSFPARSFGQSVHASEVIACMQAVSGVCAVDLDHLYRVGDAAEWTETLLPEPPDPGGECDPLAAVLLTLDPAPLDDVEVPT